MEMTHDWKAFQQMFYPAKRSLVKNRIETQDATAFAILENEVVISAFGEGEDFSDWIGAVREDLEQQLGHRKWVYFDRSMVDGWVAGTLGHGHFVEQLENIRQQAQEATLLGAGKARAAEVEGFFFRRQFMFEALRGWWGRVLPSAFGILIRLEGAKPEELFLVVRRGEVESYCRPELTTLGEERGRDREAIVKYLSEKYMVPVQGFFMDASEWKLWNEAPNPWLKLTLAIRSERVRMAPFRWGVVGMLAGRGILGV